MRRAPLLLVFFLVATPEVLFATGHLAAEHLHAIDTSSPRGVVSAHAGVEWSSDARGHHDHQLIDASGIASQTESHFGALMFVTTVARQGNVSPRAGTSLRVDIADTGPSPPLPLRI